MMLMNDTQRQYFMTCSIAKVFLTNFFSFMVLLINVILAPITHALSINCIYFNQAD